MTWLNEQEEIGRRDRGDEGKGRYGADQSVVVEMGKSKGVFDLMVKG